MYPDFLVRRDIDIGHFRDVKLLSFGGDEDAEEEPVVFKKKSIVRPDRACHIYLSVLLLKLTDHPWHAVVQSADLPASLPDFVNPSEPKKSSKRDRPKDDDSPTEKEKKSSLKDKSKDESDITKIREQHEREKSAASTARQTEIARMEADIRRLTRRAGEAGSSDDEDARAKKKPKKSYLEEEMAKYTKGRAARGKGKGKKDEGDVLAALSNFRSKLKDAPIEKSPSPEHEGAGEGAGEGGEAEAKPLGGAEDPGMEVDDDFGFLGHLLHFPKGNDEEVAKAERDYEVIDPRVRGARAREEERDRKRAMKAKDLTGGRGFRR